LIERDAGGCLDGLAKRGGFNWSRLDVRELDGFGAEVNFVGRRFLGRGRRRLLGGGLNRLAFAGGKTEESEAKENVQGGPGS